jgi:hypothetical protein
MGILRLHREPGKGFDISIWAAFLGLLLFWTAVGIVISRLI